MADIYQYSVYFDCPTLLEEKQRQKVHNYLSLRKKSGGGDCGQVTRVNDRVYTVAFRNQKAQQSVLQRREHVVKLPEGPLVFTVRASLEPDTSAPMMTSTMNPDLTAPALSPQPVPASLPPSSGEEHELQCDTYLLNYLKESDKAGKELETELASMACTAQFYPEEGRVLVRRLAQADAADEGRNWKAEVDELFDGYLCHFEVAAHKVKALLQSFGSHHSSEEVKVYHEMGMAVVVGKRAHVNDMLMDVEDYSLKIRGSCLIEKHTRRLGEAKLRLLWRELENGLREKCPGVKVTQGDAGQVVLEGSLREIVEADDWISEKESRVSERTVSNMSPHLLAFLRNAYGGQRMLGDYLRIGDEVEIELQDMKLCFFSSFVDKLDFAEESLQGKFKEVEIDVPNRCTLYMELQRMLKSKTMEMNQWQYRVNVLFNSNSTICLLGHTKEVEDLSESVREFVSQNTIQLPFPELAQELPELLWQQGFDLTGITFHMITLFSEHRLVLEGPSSKVTEVRNLLGSFLDLHVQGSDNSEQLAPSLNEGNTIVASYSLCDGLQVVVCQGDITKQDAEALVNAANEDLDHCGGVAAALSAAGGPEIQRKSNDIVKRNGKIPVGEVVVTTGGDLRCHMLLHAVGPVAREAGGREWLLLKKTIHSTLNKAEGMGIFSIAIPCISSDVLGVPLCSEAIVTAVKEFGSQEERSLKKIILIDNREEVARAMQVACDRLFQRNSSRFGTPSDAEFRMGVDSQDTDRGATAGPPEDRFLIEVVQETIENQRVDVVVSPMIGHNPLSTVVGKSLTNLVRDQLIAGFQKEAGHESFPGDAVLVKDFRGHPFNAVFFLHLCPYDGDEDGGAVQVLRTGIKQVLSSCKNSGFGSVAFPVVGAGISLKFPKSLVARVLLEEILEFKQNQVNETSFLIRIAIHPNDAEAIEVFKELLKDQVSTPTRIFLLGKTGSGKSTLGNSIFGENIFPTRFSFISETSKCQAETRPVNGRNITLIDTPGFFDTGKQAEEIRFEMMRGITECAPGPHVFLIVLKIERFTQQEQGIITEIQQNFSEDALKFAVVVFTHGDQLTKGIQIQDLISENRNLRHLVEQCGGRYHVFSNNPQSSNYSSKQVEDLLSTIDKLVMENNGGYYTNQKLQEVSDNIQMEVENIRQSSPNKSQAEIVEQAKIAVCDRLLINLSAIATGAVLGAFFAVAFTLGLDISAVNSISEISKLKGLSSVAKMAVGVVTGGRTKLIIAGVVVGSGAIAGGVVGYNAGKDANTPQEAARMAFNEVGNLKKYLTKK